MITLAKDKEVRTVFIDAKYFNPSDLRVGFDFDFTLNAICVADITYTGFYECSTPLMGKYISLQRTSEEVEKVYIYSLRAYKGINVIQFASVFKEHAHLVSPDLSAINLLRMYPRSNDVYDYQQIIPGDDSIDSEFDSCASYEHGTCDTTNGARDTYK